MTDPVAAPYRDAEFMPVDLAVERVKDGSIRFRSNVPIPAMDSNLARAFAESAARNAGTVALAERGAAGRWSTITYGEMKRRVDGVAQYLIDHLPPGAAVLTLTENSIAAAVLTFACYAARVIHTPVSPAFGTVDRDYKRLRHIVAKTGAAMIYADARPAFAAAVVAVVGKSVLVASDDPALFSRPVVALEAMQRTPVTADVEQSVAAIDPDAVATYMMTSGSTGLPKVVQLSLAALVANAAQTVGSIGKAAGWDETMLDWLPWHHAAGASVLRTTMIEGGSLYIDAGKPAPGLFDASIRNLREISVCYFNNVPTGYAMLADSLEADAVLRQRFFAKMRLMLYGGAGLSQEVFDRLQALAVQETGHRIHMTTGYGMTETTSGCLAIHFPTDKVGIGLPCPGVEVKLVPYDDRYEVRLRGPNLMVGYLDEPEKNAAAFDEQGYYRTGDLARLQDGEDLGKGLVFAGRLAEEFKLASGVWVYSGELRAALIDMMGDLVVDLVLCDENRDYLTIMAWGRPAVRADAIVERLRAFNATRKGSASTVRRLALLDSPPDPAAREMSDKGTINRRAVIDNRPSVIAALYAETPADPIHII